MSVFRLLSGRATSSSELPDIYPLGLTNTVFVKADLMACYAKILTDTLERTSGIKPEQQPSLWDNCVASENSQGLVTMLTWAMVEKADLFLVYKPALKLLRKADSHETQQIKADYAKNGESKIGVYVSFKNYDRTDMLKIYSALEYCVLASLHKSVNISKAVQIKMDSLRASVSLLDADIAVVQAKSIATALAAGKDVLLDAKDSIMNATPEVGPTEKAITFLDAKRAYILNLPLSYVSGLQGTGLGATGEGDMRAIERGLKQFYFSIVKPVCEAVFSVKTEFKSQDFRQIDSALEALKTFELVSDDDLLPRATMRTILAKLFDQDPAQVEAQLEKERKARAAAEEPDGGGADDIQTTVLNGAQIASLLDAISRVAAGELPRDAALQSIMLSFQVDEKQADRLLGSAGKAFKVAPKLVPAPSGGFGG